MRCIARIPFGHGLKKGVFHGCMAVCARCRRVSPTAGDTCCLACSAWEAIGNELSFSWSHPGLRTVATDLVVSAVRQVRALRITLVTGAAPHAASGGGRWDSFSRARPASSSAGWGEPRAA